MCDAMEADPLEQPYWNLDQYLIWLAGRDPAAVLRATDCPNSRTNLPIGWYVHRDANVDHQKVEMEALHSIKGGRVKACCVEFNGKWFTPDDPKWFADWDIECEGEPIFAAVLVRTTEHGKREKVRPRFNPQSIARLYRAPTPSNIRDRPDVENLVVGPYIAYHDALNWLAERISLRESLPIDEAGTRAKKRIRYICMNAPEKLTMWGFPKADPDELKPVTLQAWQALSIYPLAGQPEADLKAVGYRREYGAATRGEYGPVMWTGLCFDRKQFVAAFVTSGSNEPPTHTPAATGMAAPQVGPDGGRPSAMEAIESELDRWIAEGIVLAEMRRWAPRKKDVRTKTRIGDALEKWSEANGGHTASKTITKTLSAKINKAWLI